MSFYLVSLIEVFALCEACDVCFIKKHTKVENSDDMNKKMKA